MKRSSILMAGLAAAIALAAPAAATAAPWQTGINARQAQLDARIDQGLRNGALTRVEARSLRTELNGIARLEANYRRSGGGLSLAERRDLDRRLDRLNARIKIERADRRPHHRPYRR